jgi:hypothetical protein
MSNDEPARAEEHSAAPLEVIERVRAVRDTCTGILEGRINPTVDVLGGLLLIINKAMQWQAGDPPEDLEEPVG